MPWAFRATAFFGRERGWGNVVAPEAEILSPAGGDTPLSEEGVKSETFVHAYTLDPSVGCGRQLPLRRGA